MFPNWVDKINQSIDGERYSKGVLSVGRLEVQKSYAELISLLSNSDFKLTIISEGSLKNELNVMSKSQNVKLEIIPKVKFGEIIQFIKNSKSLYHLHLSKVIQK